MTAHYHEQSLYVATGVYANYDVNSIDADKNNSIVSTTRILWRRFRNGGVFHVGGAFSARSASVNNDGPVTGVLESCGVSSMLGGSVVSAEVSDLGSEVKGLAEVLYTAPRFLFQSEYFFDRLNRIGDKKAFWDMEDMCREVFSCWDADSATMHLWLFLADLCRKGLWN